MWLDILTLHEASTQPPLNIAPPPPEDFEVRLIIWQTKDVQMKGKLLKTSDMFARAWLEGSEPQKTDIHLRYAPRAHTLTVKPRRFAFSLDAYSQEQARLRFVQFPDEVPCQAAHEVPFPACASTVMSIARSLFLP